MEDIVKTFAFVNNTGGNKWQRIRRSVVQRLRRNLSYLSFFEFNILDNLIKQNPGKNLQRMNSKNFT